MFLKVKVQEEPEVSDDRKQLKTGSSGEVVGGCIRG